MAAKKTNKTRLSGKNNFSGTQTIVFALIFGIIGGLISYAAFAAPATSNKGGNKTSGGGSSLVLSPIDSSDGIVHFGKTATFTLTTTASQPWVSVACYQNGSPVYGQYWGFWSGYSPSAITSTMANNGVFTFGPTALWSSGGATCNAQLYTVDSGNYKQNVLATTSFAVAP